LPILPLWTFAGSGKVSAPHSLDLAASAFPFVAPAISCGTVGCLVQLENFKPSPLSKFLSYPVVSALKLDPPTQWGFGPTPTPTVYRATRFPTTPPFMLCHQSTPSPPPHPLSNSVAFFPCLCRDFSYLDLTALVARISSPTFPLCFPSFSLPF